MKQSDVLIIGSGMSALTCAALLSKHGKSVTVLEQYSKPGGYLHCFQRFGKRFDTGAHYVGNLEERQTFRTLLQYLGAWSDDLFVPLNPDGFDSFHFPDFNFEMPKGYDAAIDRLSARFPDDREGIRQYFTTVRDVSKHFPTYSFNEDCNFNITMESLETPLLPFLQKLIRNKKVHSILSAYCLLHGVHAENVSFGLHALVTDSLMNGPHGLKHGGDALAQLLVKRIEANGGQVLLKQRVKQLTVQDGSIKNVITNDGELYSAEWVISSVHPKATFRLLSETTGLTPAFRQRLDTMKESVGAFGVYAESRFERAGISPHKNYFFFSTSEPTKLFETQDAGFLPHCTFLAPGRATEPESTHAASMHSPSPIEWFESFRSYPYGKRPKEYGRLKETIAQNIFRLVDRDFPAFSSTVARYTTSSPLTNIHFNGSENGSAFGIYHSIENTGARALGPRTKIPNLLLTGHSTLFPGMIGAAVGALRTSGHVIGIKHVLADLRALT